MANRQRNIGPHVRPNIQISHQLNGRVKDYAAANDLELTEAYRRVIETGIEALEEERNNG